MTLPQQILSVLGESPIPVSTPDLVLIQGDGMNNARQRVWIELQKLYHKNLIQKAKARSRVAEGRGSNQRVAIWRLAP